MGERFIIDMYIHMCLKCYKTYFGDHLTPLDSSQMLNIVVNQNIGRKSLLTPGTFSGYFSGYVSGYFSGYWKVLFFAHTFVVFSW